MVDLRLCRVLLVLLLTHFIAADLSASVNSWTLVKKRGTIHVYERRIDHSPMKEVRVTGTTICKLSELVAALEDIEEHTSWVLNIGESRFVERESTGVFTYYVLINMPFPVKDRDAILRYRRSQDVDSKIVDIYTGIGSATIAQKKGTVRIEQYESRYRLVPQADNTVFLEYTLTVDPGGSIPAWVMNMASSKGPFETIQALFRLVESGKYSTHHVKGITN